MKHTSTIEELSKKLGISTSTISRALNDQPEVAPQTRKYVKEMAALMQYERNMNAVKLRTNKSYVLGIIVPSIQTSFYASFIAALEEDAKKNMYTVLILQSGENIDAEIKNFDILRKNRVDGIFASLTIFTQDIKPYLKLTEIGIPIIFFGRVPLFEACDKISIDDKKVGSLAASCLVEKYKKHIFGLFWGNATVNISQKRLKAFSEVFSSCAPDTQLDIFFAGDEEEAHHLSLQAIRSDNRPDAIFCSSDTLLIGAMSAVHETGLRIPDDIGVISISNGVIPKLYNPKVTYIETSGYKVGKLASSRLMDIFQGKTFTRELFIDSTLISAGSL